MIVTFIGLSVRLWVNNSDPDNDIHTAGGAYPDIGEFFMNTSNGALFVCYFGGVGTQQWQSTTNYTLIQAMIASIPQSNWTQVSSSASDYIKNKPTIPPAQIQSDWTQASSGSLDFIKNKPSIPTAQIQSDWTQSNNLLSDYIKNKPTLAIVATSGAYADLTGKPSLATVATTGSYSDLTGKPSLATVATTGIYADLTGKPTIPAAQINSDWTASSGVQQILNKPSLATVAISGSYLDLTNKPSIPAAQVNSDWNAVSGLAQILNKPTLATVATTGSYNDLSNKPTIPAAQIQSDWTQASTGALDYVKNKPSIPSAQIQSDWTQSNSGSVDFVKNKPIARSQSTATRTLNTAFQVSTTRWSLVRYSVDISTTVSLSGSQIGSVILEMATNAAFTTGVQTLQQFSNGNSGTLVIGLVLTQLATACLSGDVPAGNYVRLRTVNLTGTPTFTYQVGQEVLI